MKLSCFLVILLISIENAAASARSKIKYLKFYCRSSDIVVANMRCRVKSISRDEQIVNVAMDVLRPIHHLNASYIVYIQSGHTWRQIIFFERISVCEIATSNTIAQYLKLIWTVYMETFPTLPLDCPISPRHYAASNVTVMRSSEKSLISEHFPNGNFKHILTLFTSFGADKETITIDWQTEIHDKSNKDEF